MSHMFLVYRSKAHLVRGGANVHPLPKHLLWLLGQMLCMHFATPEQRLSAAYFVVPHSCFFRPAVRPALLPSMLTQETTDPQ